MMFCSILENLGHVCTIECIFLLIKFADVRLLWTTVLSNEGRIALGDRMFLGMQDFDFAHI